MTFLETKNFLTFLIFGKVHVVTFLITRNMIFLILENRRNITFQYISASFQVFLVFGNILFRTLYTALSARRITAYYRYMQTRPVFQATTPIQKVAKLTQFLLRHRKYFRCHSKYC